jgi:uncharacterized OB-fold protein
VPFVLGLIKPDGADTAMAHLVLGPVEGLKIGMRLNAVFAAERKGRILDLRGFEPERG